MIRHTQKIFLWLAVDFFKHREKVSFSKATEITSVKNGLVVDCDVKDVVVTSLNVVL